jgi:hypothetical protein
LIPVIAGSAIALAAVLFVIYPLISATRVEEKGGEGAPEND